MHEPGFTEGKQSGIALSICIPTYNFGAFIGATLESIVGQLTEKVEIIIVDGASSDDTQDVVQRFQDRSPNISYHRLNAKGGIDRDLAKTVEFARGKYCWLFSADDLMRPGAITRVLALLESHSDIYLCTHTACTLDMTYLSDYPVLARSAEFTVDLRAETERERYFGLAQTTEAFFSFVGGLIVSRSRWNSVPLNENFVGSCWAHVARMCELLLQPGKFLLTFVPGPLVDRRGDNDSFASNGVVRRYALAIDGYHKIADTFFGAKSPEAFHIRRVLRNEFRFRMFLGAFARCEQVPQLESRALLEQLVQKSYQDVPLQKFFMRCAFRLIPSRPYLWLRARYRRFRYGSAA